MSVSYDHVSVVLSLVSMSLLDQNQKLINQLFQYSITICNAGSFCLGTEIILFRVRNDG